MTGDIPVIWSHFLRDISHIFYAKRVSHNEIQIDHAIASIDFDLLISPRDLNITKWQTWM